MCYSNPNTKSGIENHAQIDFFQKQVPVVSYPKLGKCVSGHRKKDTEVLPICESSSSRGELPPLDQVGLHKVWISWPAQVKPVLLILRFCLLTRIQSYITGKPQFRTSKMCFSKQHVRRAEQEGKNRVCFSEDIFLGNDPSNLSGGLANLMFTILQGKTTNYSSWVVYSAINFQVEKYSFTERGRLWHYVCNVLSFAHS